MFAFCSGWNWVMCSDFDYNRAFSDMVERRIKKGGESFTGMLFV